MTATTPASSQRKKRPTTYGKKTGTPTFSNDLGFFDNEYASQSHEPKRSSNPRKADSPAVDAVVDAKLISGTPSVVPRSHVPAKDVFDVSSSEEESSIDYIERPALTKPPKKRPLFDDRCLPSTKPTAWSDKRQRLSNTPRKNVTFAAVDEHSTPKVLPVHTKRTVAKPVTQPSSKQTSNAAVLAGMSAIERLKYRKSGPAISSENNGTADNTGTGVPISHAHRDHIQHGDSSTVTESHSSPKQGRLKRVVKTTPASPMPPQEHAAKDPLQDLTMQADHAMSDADMSEVFGSPQASMSAQAPAIPDPSTPPRSSLSTPRTKGKHTTGLTPKQDRLWQDLFEDISGPKAMRGLSRSGPSAGRKISISPPAGTPRSNKARLVDQLRAAAPHDDEASSDVDMDEAPSADSIAVDIPANPRRTAPRTVATHLTYTQQRSHLAEDSIEDAMLLSLAHNPLPERTSNLSNSAFDLDDDLETNSVQIRSVHELRARGKSSRVTAEIDELLQDVNQTTAQSRHITALIKLATHFLDDDFAKTFTQHNHEAILLDLLPDSTDELSKALLIIASLLLLRHDIPRPALQRFKDALLHSTGLLHIETEVAALISTHSAILGRSKMALSTLLRKTKKLSELWVDGVPDALRVRTLYLRAIDLLVSKLRRSGDASALLSDDALTMICPPGLFSKTTGDSLDASIVISLLESLSTLYNPSDWPATMIETIAALPAALSRSSDFSRHTRFLAYRLCLNVTNDKNIDHFLFARAGTLQSLPRDIITGFKEMTEFTPDAEVRKLKFDLLILAIGILINLSEYSKAARQAILQEESLVEMVQIFKTGHEQVREAESEDESTSNVAFGYLAIMLANFCQEASVRETVRLNLEGQSLDSLVQAVEEFVQHHQKVDRTDFEGAEGQKVWSSFTERLQFVLARLKKHV